jgi:hypothetical protein
VAKVGASARQVFAGDDVQRLVAAQPAPQEQAGRDRRRDGRQVVDADRGEDDIRVRDRLCNPTAVLEQERTAAARIAGAFDEAAAASLASQGVVG